MCGHSLFVSWFVGYLSYLVSWCVGRLIVYLVGLLVSWWGDCKLVITRLVSLLVGYFVSWFVDVWPVG
jgi:hypothetical protein